MSVQESANDFALRYLRGQGVKKDVAKAIEILTQAAEEGDGAAAFNLGYIYRVGREVPQNAELAIKWLRKSAEDKNSAGLRVYHDLGFCLLDSDFLGGYPTLEMEEEAFLSLKEAAGFFVFPADKELSEILAEAKMRLGVCYFQGTGTEVNISEGIRWMREAAEGGNDVAQNNMGIIYKDGQGVNPDSRAAIMWFRKAAEQGNPEAQFNLGCCLIDTEFNTEPLTDEMVREAYDYACASVEQGYTHAYFLLEIFYRTGTYVRKDIKKAYECLKIAADNGHEFSQERLSHYKKGILGYTYIP